jgi:hypothetical protein
MAAGPGLRADGLDTGLIPADARWVIHIDMKAVSASRIKALWLEKAPAVVHRRMEKSRSMTHLDIFRDLDGVTISGVGAGDKQAVVALQGRFDREFLVKQLHAAMDVKEFKRGSLVLYDWERACAVFDGESRLFFGENRNLLESLFDDRGKITAAGGGSPVAEVLKQAPKDAMVVAAASRFFECEAEDPASVLLKKTHKALFYVLEKAGRLNVRAALTTESDKTADNLVKIVNGLLALLEIREKEFSRDWPVLRNLKIRSEGNALLMETSGTPEEYMQLWPDWLGGKLSR